SSQGLGCVWCFPSLVSHTSAFLRAPSHARRPSSSRQTAKAAGNAPGSPRTPVTSTPTTSSNCFGAFRALTAVCALRFPLVRLLCHLGLHSLCRRLRSHLGPRLPLSLLMWDFLECSLVLPLPTPP
ncbi:unnamed protein product, partial [Ectocarpus sp. 12 AP-2014]